VTKTTFITSATLSMSMSLYAFDAPSTIQESLNLPIYTTKQSLNYTYSPSPKPIQPFQKIGFLRSPYFRLIKDFNFYILPKQISFMTDMNRRYHERKTRILSEDDIRVKTTYEKDWRWNRKYDLRWDITKSLKLTFGAVNTSRINEPDGKIDDSLDDYELKRDSIIDEIFALGTTKKYTHRFNLNYSIPINKIPLLNWVNASVRYGGDYYSLKVNYQRSDQKLITD